MEPTNITTKYLESLPDNIKNVISNPNIESRTKEISRKYSLNAEQGESLVDIVMLVLVGIDSPDTLIENIMSDLSVSEIVAEQIMNDLEGRVFEYALKESGSTDEVPRVSRATAVDVNLPEIRPDNLPSTEVTDQIPVKNNVPVYTPKPKVLVGEPVQTPVSVPRFRAVPLTDNEIGADFIPKLAPKPSAGGIMESKLNNVTPGITETEKDNSPIIKNYSVDPYREPLN